MALQGVKVVEFAGLAPGPFAGLILADWGADVIRVDRPSATSSPDTLCRNKRSIAVDVKHPDGLAVLKRLVDGADVLIDPFRPGVMERLGLGPEVFLCEGGRNRGLVYARLAGFPPTGPHKDMAGHDINYLALSGALSLFPGDTDKPAFPLNILADFAGGGMTCAMGILLALIERNKSGRGQVISTDMVSGTRYLSSYALTASLHPPDAPLFNNPAVAQSPPISSNLPTARMTHTLDGGAPFYNVYTCADGRWMSLGCLEPQFFKAFMQRFVDALPEEFLERAEWSGKWQRWNGKEQYRKEGWGLMKRFFEEGFRLYDRDYWTKVFHGSDACALPVLSPAEAAVLASSSTAETIPAPHPHLMRTPDRGRDTLIPRDGQLTLTPGQHTNEVLRELGLSVEELQKLGHAGVLGKTSGGCPVHKAKL